MRSQGTTRVVVLDDRVLEDGMRQVLASSGFHVIEAASVAAGTQLLRESSEPMTVLFWVSLAAQTMTGLDQATLLGELLRDESLARRHAYILISPTPLAARDVLGCLIDRLRVTLLAAPLDRERLLSAMWLASQRCEAPASVGDGAGASPS